MAPPATTARTHGRDLLLLVLVNALWAVQFPAYKAASSGLPIWLLTTATFAGATAMTWPFAIRARRRRRSLPTGDAPKPALRHWILVGVFGLVPASGLMAQGTVLASASHAALLSLSIPILTAVVAAIVLRERLSPRGVASLVLSLIGVLIVSRGDLAAGASVSGRVLLGNVLILGSCLSSVVYNVFSKALLAHYDGLEVMAYGYATATVVGVAMTLLLERGWMQAVVQAPASAWLAVAVLAVFSWGLAMVLWMSLLARIDVSLVSLSIYLLPFFGVLVSAAFLGERLRSADLVGGLITLAGTVLATVASGRSRTAAEGSVP